jgi:hypothetical protein
MNLRKLRLPFAALALVLLVTACSEMYATSTADTHACVYDGSERGGQKLKFQIAPGQESKQIDDNDVVVTIPASNRFFMASNDDNIRDPLAPHDYETYAAASVKVQVQGQVRFRFNLSNACEWFAKHGRRNTPDGKTLGFNARGGDANNAGWFRFLAENFGTTMQQTADQVVNQFNARPMVEHYPDNADPDSGIVPKDQQAGEDIDSRLGVVLGKRFTELLTANLGGEYFCGIDSTDANDPCPDMTFQVTAVHTSDPAIEQSWQDVERTRNDLDIAQQKGALENQQAEALAASAAAHQAILDQQAAAARSQAEINDAQCLVRAEHGLDCDGHLPPVIVNGQQAN